MTKCEKHRSSKAIVALACSAAMFIAGGFACNNPNNRMQQPPNYKPIGNPVSQPKPVSKPPNQEESNIIRVNKIFDSFPWLSFTNDGSDRVTGFKAAVYLEGPNSTKGVFGSGTIVITVYRIDQDKAGRELQTEVKCWTFTREEAMAYRAKDMSMIGWGYGFRLNWGEDIELSGKKIAIVFKYVRDDGRVVSSSRKMLRVPFTGDMQPMPVRPANSSKRPAKKPVPRAARNP